MKARPKPITFPVTPDAAASIRDMETRAAGLEDTRDDGGKFVPRYPGISAPAIPPAWDRKEARATLREHLPAGKWLAVPKTAAAIGATVAETLSILERLAWFGWRWKAAGKVYEIETAVCVDGVISLDHLIATPDGAQVIGFVRLVVEDG